MNRLSVVILLFCCVAFLYSCHSDEKQAVKIHEKMEESLFYEEEFASNQDDLDEYRKKEQLVYNDLIDLDIQDKDTLKQKIDDAYTYTEKQKTLLDEAEENFQRAYEASTSIEENIEEIQDNELKDQASELLEMMEERKELIDTFCDDYQHKLKLLASFYECLNDGEFNFDELEDRIDEINNRNQVMEDVIQQFNQLTEQYQATGDKYYEMAEID